jgi:hypothetical protein
VVLLTSLVVEAGTALEAMPWGVWRIHEGVGQLQEVRTAYEEVEVDQHIYWVQEH